MTSKNTAYILSNMNSVLYNRYGMRCMRRLTYDTSAVAKIAYFSHLYFYQPLLLFVVASLGYFKNIIILCILCKQCYTSLCLLNQKSLFQTQSSQNGTMLSLKHCTCRSSCSNGSLHHFSMMNTGCKSNRMQKCCSSCIYHYPIQSSSGCTSTFRCSAESIP